jgi:hypothetical protein
MGRSPYSERALEYCVRIIIHAKSGSHYTAKNLYVKALIRGAKLEWHVC